MKKTWSLTLIVALIVTTLIGCSNAGAASAESEAIESTQAEIRGTAGTAETGESSQIDNALALINSFATGDTAAAKELLKEDYIQHNLAYGTGGDAFVGSVEYLSAAEEKTTVENIRAFEDGDYVFLQTIYNFAGAGEQVAFDIFRFEDGLIAEHWDVMETIADETTWANENGKF